MNTATLPNFRDDLELTTIVEVRDALAIQCGRAQRDLKRVLDTVNTAAPDDVAETAAAAAKIHARHASLRERLLAAEGRVAQAEGRAREAIRTVLRDALLDAFRNAVGASTKCPAAQAWADALTVLDHINTQFPDLKGLLPGEQAAAEQISMCIFTGHKLFRGSFAQNCQSAISRVEEAVVRAALREPLVGDLS